MTANFRFFFYFST
ncbi:pheST operon leader peptide PheM [Erwiniaceae bacterium CMYE1]|nr:pheST operon leader peptide PheM [Erwinia phyllosphaerae]